MGERRGSLKAESMKVRAPIPELLEFLGAYDDRIAALTPGGATVCADRDSAGYGDDLRRV
jgi:hypothetical protein